MEKILEIRDICKTPRQLLSSDAFRKYLEMYKEFIKELKRRQGPQRGTIT